MRDDAREWDDAVDDADRGRARTDETPTRGGRQADDGLAGGLSRRRFVRGLAAAGVLGGLGGTATGQDGETPAPVAVLSYYPYETVDVGTTLRIDLSESYDPAGVGIADYQIIPQRRDGGGFAVDEDGPRNSITIDQPGVWYVHIDVETADGRIGSNGFNLTVPGDGSDLPRVGVDTGIGQPPYPAGTELTFQPDTPLDAEVRDEEWLIESGPTEPELVKQDTITRTFEEPNRTWIVTYRATLKNGRDIAHSVPIPVEGPGEEPPTAVVDGPTTAELGTTRTFDATASQDYDAGGNDSTTGQEGIMGYEWEVAPPNGEAWFTTGPTLSLDLDQTGEWTFGLTVTDSELNEGYGSHEVTVTNGPVGSPSPIEVTPQQTSATVVWSDVDDPSGVTAYVVDVFEAGREEPSTTRQFGGDTTTATVADLAPGRSYEVTVTAVDGPDSKTTAGPVSFRTVATPTATETPTPTATETPTPTVTETPTPTETTPDVPLIDGTRPTDPDDDGLYEDLSGNEGVDFNDVTTYFQEMGEGTLSSHTRYFDYSGNGEIDYVDLIDLFGQV